MFLHKGSTARSIGFVSLRSKVFRQSQMMPSKETGCCKSMTFTETINSKFISILLVLLRKCFCTQFRFVLNLPSSSHSLELKGLPCLSLPGTWIAEIVPSRQPPQFCFKDKCYSSHQNELVWFLTVSHQSIVYYGSEIVHTQKKNNAINW